MASIGAAGLAAKGGISSTGLSFDTGFFAGISGRLLVPGAGYIDSKFLMPMLHVGKKQRPPKLLDLPTMTAAPGSPLIWAIGRRVRVPVHVMFQSDKVREVGSGAKIGPQGNVKKVQSDVGVLLNTRPSKRLTQLVGNGKLLIFATRNLVSVPSATTVASVVGGRLRLTAGSVQDPDYKDSFKVDDRVQLGGWVANGGPNVNLGYWKVHAVTAHAGTTPSHLDLDI